MRGLDVLLRPDDARSQGQLAGFIGWLFEQGLASSTIKAYTNQVLHWQRVVGGVAIRKGYAVTVVLAGVARLGRPPRTKPVISPAELKQVLTPLGLCDPVSLCLRTALVMAFAGCWRASRYCAGPPDEPVELHHTVLWRDVLVDMEGDDVVAINVVCRSSKTAPGRSAAPRSCWMGAADDDKMSPVFLLRRWLGVARRLGLVGPDRPVFAWPDGRAIEASWVNSFLRRRSLALGLHVGRLTTHVMRGSGVTCLLLAGVSYRRACRHGGWFDSTVNQTVRGHYAEDDKVEMVAATRRMMAVPTSSIRLGTRIVDLD